jgi:rhamnogalacturonyl hydrolase YesR
LYCRFKPCLPDSKKLGIQKNEKNLISNFNINHINNSCRYTSRQVKEAKQQGYDDGFNYSCRLEQESATSKDRYIESLQKKFAISTSENEKLRKKLYEVTKIK